MATEFNFDFDEDENNVEHPPEDFHDEKQDEILDKLDDISDKIPSKETDRPRSEPRSDPQPSRSELEPQPSQTFKKVKEENEPALQKVEAGRYQFMGEEITKTPSKQWKVEGREDKFPTIYHATEHIQKNPKPSPSFERVQEDEPALEKVEPGKYQYMGQEITKTPAKKWIIEGEEEQHSTIYHATESIEQRMEEEKRRREEQRRQAEQQVEPHPPTPSEIEPEETPQEKFRIEKINRTAETQRLKRESSRSRSEAIKNLQRSTKERKSEIQNQIDEIRERQPHQGAALYTVARTMGLPGYATSAILRQQLLEPREQQKIDELQKQKDDLELRRKEQEREIRAREASFREDVFREEVEMRKATPFKPGVLGQEFQPPQPPNLQDLEDLKVERFSGGGRGGPPTGGDGEPPSADPDDPSFLDKAIDKVSEIDMAALAPKLAVAAGAVFAARMVDQKLAQGVKGISDSLNTSFKSVSTEDPLQFIQGRAEITKSAMDMAPMPEFVKEGLKAPIDMQTTILTSIDKNIEAIKERSTAFGPMTLATDIENRMAILESDISRMQQLDPTIAAFSEAKHELRLALREMQNGLIEFFGPILTGILHLVAKFVSNINMWFSLFKEMVLQMMMLNKHFKKAWNHYKSQIAKSHASVAKEVDEFFRGPRNP